MKTSIVKLQGRKNYAILSSSKISFALNADDKELKEMELVLKKETFKLEKFDSEKIASLGIIPTFDCNLKCIYCYSKGGDTKEIINYEDVINVINYIKSQKSGAEIFNLHLVGGGEPLLYFDLVNKIVLYAKTKFENVKIHVVTNGTFNQKVLNWLISENVSVRISYDGIGQANQRPYRIGSYSDKIVKENIKELVANKIFPMIQCIITSKTIDFMKEIVNDICVLGVEVIKFEPVSCTDVSRGENDLEPNPVIFANKLIEVIEYIANNNLPVMIDTGYFCKPTENNYCGIARGNFILTPEGMITSCVEVARKADPYQKEIMIGKFNRNSIDFFENNFLNKLHPDNYMGGCKECNLKMICLGGCPMSNIWENGIPIKKSKYTCELQHEFLPKLLFKIATNPKVMDVIMENAERIEF